MTPIEVIEKEKIFAVLRMQNTWKVKQIINALYEGVIKVV